MLPARSSPVKEYDPPPPPELPPNDADADSKFSSNRFRPGGALLLSPATLRGRLANPSKVIVIGLACSGEAARTRPAKMRRR